MTDALIKFILSFIYNLSKYYEASPHTSYETSYLFIYSSFEKRKNTRLTLPTWTKVALSRPVLGQKARQNRQFMA